MKLLFFTLLILTTGAQSDDSIRDKYPPDQGRTCATIRALAPEDPMQFRKLPSPVNGRKYVPFGLIFGPDGPTKAADRVDIYIGDSEDLATGKFYIIRLKRDVIQIRKFERARDLDEELDSVKLSMFTEGEWRGFFFRTKLRANYASVGLYEGGDDGSFPTLMFEDEKFTIKSFNFYAFTVARSTVRL